MDPFPEDESSIFGLSQSWQSKWLWLLLLAHISWHTCYQGWPYYLALCKLWYLFLLDQSKTPLLLPSCLPTLTANEQAWHLTGIAITWPWGHKHKERKATTWDDGQKDANCLSSCRRYRATEHTSQPPSSIFPFQF